MKVVVLRLIVLSALLTLGCAARVETTEDSVKTEVETPKVERGDEALDLNPKTDDDLDVDTSLPGDT